MCCGAVAQQTNTFSACGKHWRYVNFFCTLKHTWSCQSCQSWLSVMYRLDIISRAIHTYTYIWSLVLHYAYCLCILMCAYLCVEGFMLLVCLWLCVTSWNAAICLSSKNNTFFSMCLSTAWFHCRRLLFWSHPTCQCFHWLLWSRERNDSL